MRSLTQNGVSFLLGLALSLLLGAAALASPPQRAAKVVEALGAEGYTQVQSNQSRDGLVLVAAHGRPGVAVAIVQHHGSDAGARAGLVGAVRRAEESRLKVGLRVVSRRRVQLEGAEGARLLRFKSDEAQAVVLLFCVGSETVDVALMGRPTPKSLKRIAKAVVSTVETVPATGRGGVTSQGLVPGQVLGTGTGFYVSKDVILTNAHVVQDAKEVRLVATDGTRFMGKVVVRGTSSSTLDLAMIRVTRRGSPLPLARVESLQNVFAYGYGSLGGTTEALLATEGRISGTIRGALVTTAHVNPGNSGGPLVDASGRAVGVVFAKSRTEEGDDALGLVIPSETARGWLAEHGVRVSVTPSQARGSAPNDERVRRAVVRIELLAGR